MDKKRLDLKFRPDDVFAKPIYGDLKPASGLLLKVVYRRRRRDVPGPSTEDTQSADEPHIEILGAVRSMFKFEGKLRLNFQISINSINLIIIGSVLGLCDYQYLPIARNLSTARSEFIYNDIVPNGLLSPDWLT